VRYTKLMLLIAFGITGDLMRLKILPALEQLHTKGLLPTPLQITGISRRDWDDEQLRSYVRKLLPKAQESFLSLFTFLQGDTDNQETFATLARLAATDEVLMYLSLAPTLYQSIFTNMELAGFGTRGGCTRIMLEKPFGTSGEHAEQLYDQLRNLTFEEDIFLVDHYLAKEWVQELSTFLTPTEQVAKIELRFFETVGLEERGAVYDRLGALRDVVQNHLLQMLAHLVGSQARTEMLEQLSLLTPAQITDDTVRAQYIGYLDIPGIAPGSQTETYCKVASTLTTPGWEGVTCVFEAGKRLPETRKEVTVTMKDGQMTTIPERPNITPEYEQLLYAATRGDHTLFPSIQEVRAQWRFINPILKTWAAGTPKLETYSPGTIPQHKSVET
jgi:glucose-6-phosphate 1-dehydrogenase